jgi:hypothetical protein
MYVYVQDYTYTADLPWVAGSFALDASSSCTLLVNWGSGFRVHCSGFRLQGSEFRVQSSGFRVQGSGFRGQGSGFRVSKLGFSTRRVIRAGGLLLLHPLNRSMDGWIDSRLNASVTRCWIDGRGFGTCHRLFWTCGRRCGCMPDTSGPMVDNSSLSIGREAVMFVNLTDLAFPARRVIRAGGLILLHPLRRGPVPAVPGPARMRAVRPGKRLIHSNRALIHSNRARVSETPTSFTATAPLSTPTAPT